MLAYIAAYVASALAFMAADAGWFALAVPRLYKPVIGPLLSGRVNVGAAVAFYLVYVAGVIFFAVTPALRSGQWRTAALNGLVLGLVAYGTYDLTNQATLRLWSTRLTVVDMAWGGAITALAATLGFLAARKAGG